MGKKPRELSGTHKIALATWRVRPPAVGTPALGLSPDTHVLHQARLIRFFALPVYRSVLPLASSLFKELVR